jgi:hypothetical protein
MVANDSRAGRCARQWVKFPLITGARPLGKVTAGGSQTSGGLL